MTIDLYFAGPQGFSEAGRDFMYNKIVPIFEMHKIIVLDPWKINAYLFENINKLPKSERFKELEKANYQAGLNNEKAIEKSDGIFAVLDGSDVDSGTASEIGYGTALGKKIIGYRSDFRLTRDNIAATVNLQVEYFIKKNGGQIINSIEHIPEALIDVFPKYFSY